MLKRTKFNLGDKKAAKRHTAVVGTSRRPFTQYIGTSGVMDEFEWFEDDDLETFTSREQCSCEAECAKFLLPFERYDANKLSKLRKADVLNEDNEIRLMRDLHAKYLERGLSNGLPSGFVSLDASRPWMCYWILHALYLLKREPTHLYGAVVPFLSRCQNEATTGGFGGGPGQLSHCAPTYAAVLALCTIGTDEALASISRSEMYAFFMSVKDPATGAFCMHHDGEIDTRSVYTVLSVSRLLHILTPELTQGCAPYLVACQSYEGGFGGEPGNEAHGGYNFCALAALLILGSTNGIDLEAQEYWLQQRQVRLEGGFQGRTNKTVDSCYSFWQGSALALVKIVDQGGSDVADMEHFAATNPATLLDSAASAGGSSDGDVDEVLDLEQVGTALFRVNDESGELPFNQKALQRYVLQCGQSIESEGTGGLRDKPGKGRDFYHSCYALSGLAIAQSFALPGTVAGAAGVAAAGAGTGGPGAFALPSKSKSSPAQVFGDLDNILEPTSAVFNIGLPKLHRALHYFAAQPRWTHDEMLALAAAER